jgi:hypothetical protein
MVVSAAAPFLRRRTIALLVLLILTLYGFEAHARRREKSAEATLGDQSAYLAYARHLSDSNSTVVEDRNRMPVYPFLLSLIYRPGMTEPDFLVRAQAFTVNLSIVLLLLSFFIFRRFFPPLQSLALLAATAFGVFLYRAERAQVELLFYFVSFCAFVLLTKASVLPALVAWAVVFGAQILFSFRHDPWRRLAMLALVLGAFLAVVFPYIQTSKRIYGTYFYNVNSTFVMWCDSSTEGYEFLSAHGDKDQWRQLPPDQLPSFRKYWREHSVSQIAWRIVHGSRDLATQNARVIGYYKFVISLLVAGAVLWVRQRQRAREILARNSGAAIFCGLFFAGYFLLYAWYDAIINDSRFVLSIFLPFVFAGSLYVLRLGRGRVVSIARRQIPFEQFFPLLFSGLAMIDLLYNVPSLFR